MSRRAYKTVNLPRELVDWIDQILRSHRKRGGCGPFGVASRDEFVRLAVAVLGAALQDQENGEVPLARVQAIVQRLREGLPAPSR